MIPLLHRTPYLRNHILRCTATLTAAHIGHNTIGTVIVAAIHNGHPRRKLATACNGQILSDLAVTEDDIHNR